jgi:hypothetical protein
MNDASPLRARVDNTLGRVPLLEHLGSSDFDNLVSFDGNRTVFYDFAAAVHSVNDASGDEDVNQVGFISQ